MSFWKKWTVLLPVCLMLLCCKEALADGTLLLPDTLTAIEADAFRGDTGLKQSDTKNLFPYWLVTGVGDSGPMPADEEYGDSDGLLNFNELFRYVYAKTRYKQTACCYPKDSLYPLFIRRGE